MSSFPQGRRPRFARAGHISRAWGKGPRTMYLSPIDHRRQGFRWLDRALITFGLACLMVYGIAAARTAIYQRHAKAEINQMISLPVPETAPPAAPLMPGDVVGRIDVP